MTLRRHATYHYTRRRNAACRVSAGSAIVEGEGDEEAWSLGSLVFTEGLGPANSSKFLPKISLAR